MRMRKPSVGKMPSILELRQTSSADSEQACKLFEALDRKLKVCRTFPPFRSGAAHAHAGTQRRKNSWHVEIGPNLFSRL